jgi:hypothetical protein
MTNINIPGALIEKNINTKEKGISASNSLKKFGSMKNILVKK